MNKNYTEQEMGFSGPNRRRFPRRPISMQVKYRTMDSFFYDYSLNLSHGGIFIKTRRPLPRGSSVEIEFDVEGADKTFKTTGLVARVIFPGEDDEEPSGMAIEFKPLSDADKELIDLLWTESAAGKGGSKG